MFDNPSNLNNGLVRLRVCGNLIGTGPAKHRFMPNAWVTYRNFWADTALVQQFEGVSGVTQAGSCGQ